MPQVSVILPVYNAARFLREAIDSVLRQSFDDFELIILNDGSTDDTKKIIQSYTDSRIRYVENEQNSGLVFTLNRGIDLCRADLVARMDGDDICSSTRFAKQVRTLRSNPEIDLLATIVSPIGEEGESLSDWTEDTTHLSWDSIRGYLPANNCIAHPTIMAKTTLLREYRYRPSQKLAEDYDLWLRLAADGRRIEKLNERLLLHRILKSSFTRTRQRNVFFKIMRVKQRFAKERLQEGKWNSFVTKTFLYSLVDGVKGIFKQIKSLFR